MINFSRLEENVFIGSAPKNSVDAARLKQMKITAVLSLQSDADLRSHQINWKTLQSAYQYNDINVQRFAIMDFDETDLGRKLPDPILALNTLLENDHRVYVHCNAGVCRAPATVLGYLCHFREMSTKQGLEYIRSQRPQAHPYIGAVEAALKQLSKGS